MRRSFWFVIWPVGVSIVFGCGLCCRLMMSFSRRLRPGSFWLRGCVTRRWWSGLCGLCGLCLLFLFLLSFLSPFPDFPFTSVLLPLFDALLLCCFSLFTQLVDSFLQILRFFPLLFLLPRLLPGPLPRSLCSASISSPPGSGTSTESCSSWTCGSSSGAGSGL